MKTFIINSFRGVVAQKKKFDVASKLIGREWRMLSDDPTIFSKYIFLKGGKLLLSISGVSTYSQWQMVTDSSIIMDEGVATFLYKIFHLDENLMVLNLDGTDSFCFLINDESTLLSNASLEDIQWYLFRQCNIDILSPEQKSTLNYKRDTLRYSTQKKVESKGDSTPLIILGVMLVLILLFMFSAAANSQ